MSVPRLPRGHREQLNLAAGHVPPSQEGAVCMIHSRCVCRREICIGHWGRPMVLCFVQGNQKVNSHPCRRLSPHGSDPRIRKGTVSTSLHATSHWQKTQTLSHGRGGDGITRGHQGCNVGDGHSVCALRSTAKFHSWLDHNNGLSVNPGSVQGPPTCSVYIGGTLVSKLLAYLRTCCYLINKILLCFDSQYLWIFPPL